MVKKRAITASVLMVILLGSWVAAPGEQGRPMRGQAIYDEYCFRCHGMKGQGDGPEARIQIVPPANFQSPRSRAKADFELLTIVSGSNKEIWLKARGKMPKLSHTLSLPKLILQVHGFPACELSRLWSQDLAAYEQPRFPNRWWHGPFVHSQAATSGLQWEAFSAELFCLNLVSYGIAFSPMHGFRGRLTDDELLEVIDYIRTMAPFLPLT